MRRILLGACVIAGMSMGMAARAADFSIAFEWGDIPLCTTGNPNVVDNPSFTLSNVPAGTAEIRFRLQDLNVPSFIHGGGSVAYTGENVIKPGAFQYRSPCPPGGRHLYEWTATALDSHGGELGKAKAHKEYP